MDVSLQLNCYFGLIDIYGIDIMCWVSEVLLVDLFCLGCMGRFFVIIKLNEMVILNQNCELCY